ncbi:alpha-2,3-sialyltransferase [Neorhizobium alkalisoli]|uniref:alpha-2,3-sialyltransferase n=1 Tax=Neorhizobium alkalisoli TaxID=528178 RepID=UPI000CFA77FC|nr:alpha-2,3-sialyltransferase [Neorhizobium alkalisoli]
MASFPKNYTSLPSQIETVFELFKDRLDKPCYIAGNGPSVNEVSLSDDEIADGTVFRANWFFLEEEKRFGDRVDGFFWSVENKGLRNAIQEIQARDQYTIKAFFQPFLPSDAKDRVVNGTAAAMLPNYDHWAVIATNPTLARFLMGRPLPTQGMQMIAFAAILGFNKIYLAGIDLYEQAASRYAWNVPEDSRKHLQEKDYKGGYESNHDLEVDLMFLRAVREQYKFELIGLSQMNVMAPYLDGSERRFTTRQTPATKGGNIYVTLADGRYSIGAMALARSLAKVSDVPLLVLHSDPYTPRALAHLPNVQTRYVEKLANPHNPSQTRFLDTFTKLRVFDLLEYDRITFIDADCIILKNIDDLFQYEEMLAAPDWGIEITSDFNSGLFSFTPSADLQNRVFRSLLSHESSDGGDQGFLNSVFGQEMKRLPPEYNMLKRLVVHHPNLVNMADVKVIHFVGDKPWDVHVKKAEFTQLESLWSTFLEVKDWQHEFWMNKTFVSRRWQKQGTRLEKPQPTPADGFQKRLNSYGSVKRHVVRLGDRMLPPSIAKPIDRFLKKAGIL